jgi:MoaA/NifB/PqqE/SkfB family radical SAM enzyme
MMALPMKRVPGILASYGLAALGRKSPLGVSWMLTRRCNKRCRYCGRDADAGKAELSSREALRIVDELAAGSVRFIGFTGGEVLLRDDFGGIVARCISRGMSVKVNTNGSLLRDRWRELRKIDVLQLSLDGPEDVHDRIRGEGTFRSVRDAIAGAKAHGIPVVLNTVVSRLNADALEYVLAVCRDNGIKAFFEPATLTRLGSPDERNLIAPETETYQRAVTQLMRFKRRGKYRQHIGNSLAGLEYLSHWPEPRPVPCWAGLLLFRIDPQGMLYNCSEDRAVDVGRPILELGFAECVRRLRYAPCRECWCAQQVESNLVLSLDPRAVMNFLASS